MVTSYADLVIIGAGPAGCMAAAWASKYPQLRCRVLERNSERCKTGHADGLVSRSLEILDSFGIVEKIYKDAYREVEMCSWTPDASGVITRNQRIATSKVGISRFQGCEIHQGVIEQNFIDYLASQPTKLSVERSVVTESLTVDVKDEYPITLCIRHGASSDKPETGVNGDERHFSHNGNGDHADEHDRRETIKAKYVIGCDGAHSWTRQQVGLTLEGEQSDDIYGVIDIVPLTDFPDIRQSCAIHSAEHGSIMTVPREGRLVRFYIQLSDIKVASKDDRIDISQIKPEILMSAARKIMHPYKLEYKVMDWFSVYRIGQRVAPKFSYLDRVFLAGDAVHTHSPKMGQGMNVSMQDSSNVIWKVCSVAARQSKPEILQTYQTERHAVACELISVDRQFAQFYSRKLDSDASGEDIRRDNQSFRNRFYDFLSGVAVEYRPSVLVTPGQVSNAHPKGPSSKQHLALKAILGRRIPSCRIVNQAEVRPVQLHDLLKADGHWRLLVFAGDLSNTAQSIRFERLGKALTSPASCLQKYPFRSKTGTNGHIPTPLVSGQLHKVESRCNSLVELFTIHAAKRTSISLLELPEVFYGPWDEELGWDYWKVFVDDDALHEGPAEAYEQLGIDRTRGCLVVVRPDQHVSYIGELEDIKEVETFLAGCLVAGG